MGLGLRTSGDFVYFCLKFWALLKWSFTVLFLGFLSKVGCYFQRQSLMTHDKLNGELHGNPNIFF